YVVVNSQAAGEPLLLPIAADLRTLPHDMERSCEQRAGERANIRSDIWAAGHVLNRLVQAVPLDNAVQSISAANRGQLAEIAAKCLEADPALRYASAQEVLNALDPSSR